MSCNVITDDDIRVVLSLIPEEHMRYFYKYLGGTEKFNKKKFPDFAVNQISKILSDGMCNHSSIILKVKTQGLTPLIQTGGAFTRQHKAIITRVIAAILLLFIIKTVLHHITNYTGEINYLNAVSLCNKKELDQKRQYLEQRDWNTTNEIGEVYETISRLFTYAWNTVKANVDDLEEVPKEILFSTIGTDKDTCLIKAKTDYEKWQLLNRSSFFKNSLVTYFAVAALDSLVQGKIAWNSAATTKDLWNTGGKLGSAFLQMWHKEDEEQKTAIPIILQTVTQQKPQQKPQQQKNLARWLKRKTVTQQQHAPSRKKSNKSKK